MEKGHMQEENNLKESILNLQEDIQDKIYENAKDTTKASDIISDVNTLETLYDKKHFEKIKELSSKVHSLQEQLDEEMRESEKFSKLRVYMKDLFILRMYLNEQFHNRGKKYESILRNTVTQEMLRSFSRRESIYEKPGYRFAVYLLCVNENTGIVGVTCISKSDKFSDEMCKFYIQLNDKLHPNVIPHSIVMNAIRELRSSVNESSLREYSITNKVLDEMEHFS